MLGVSGDAFIFFSGDPTFDLAIRDVPNVQPGNPTFLVYPVTWLW